MPIAPRHVFFLQEEQTQGVEKGDAKVGIVLGGGCRAVGGVGGQWAFRGQGDHAFDVFGSGSGLPWDLGVI